MNKLVILLAAAFILGGPDLVLSQDAKAPPAAQTPAPSKVSDIVFSGKLYSPIKKGVMMPITAEVTKIMVELGHPVKNEEIVARYRVPEAQRIADKTAVSQAGIKSLEAQLITLDATIYKAEQRRKELEFMEKESMATSQALALVAKDTAVNEKSKSNLLLQLAQAKESYNDNLTQIKKRYGPDFRVDNIPKEGVIRSEMDGYIMWQGPEVREGATLPAGYALFQVGTMNPLIIRTMVHEIEAQKLSVGDTGKVVFESVPGREFTATVSRIPWAPAPASLQQPSYYEIEMTIPNPDLVLKEGLKGEITIIPKK